MGTPGRQVPILRCPVELLSTFIRIAIGSIYDSEEHIFHCDNNPDTPFPILHPRYHGSDYPLDNTVSHRRETYRLVCKDWNSIIEASPFFWTQIVYGGNWPHEQLSIWLERSKKLDIHLILRLPWLLDHNFDRGTLYHVGDTDTQDMECDDLYEILFPHRDRLSAFELSSACSLQMIFLVERLAPVLLGKRIKTVGLHHTYNCETDIDKNVIAHFSPFHSGNHSLAIRNLMISHIQALPTRYLPRMTNLTLLDIRFDDSISGFEAIWEYIKAVLNDCHELQSLRMALQIQPPNAVLHGKIDIPSLSSLSIALTEVEGAREFISQFVLPHLRTMAITFNSYDSGADFSDAYQSINGHSPYVSMTLLHRKSLFVGLEQLSITYGHVDRHTALSTMQSLLRLKFLSLYNIKDEESGTMVFLAILLDLCVEKEMADRLGTYSDICCPNLSTLETHDSDGLTEKKLVEARRRISYPIACTVHT